MSKLMRIIRSPQRVRRILRRLIRSPAEAKFAIFWRLSQSFPRAMEVLHRLIETAQSVGVRVLSLESLGIFYKALGRHKDAVSYFERAGTRLSGGGQLLYMQSLFELGDFARIEAVAEKGKLSSVSRLQYLAYSSLYFSRWGNAARHLSALVDLNSNFYRPHINIAARDLFDYSPVLSDKLLAPEALLFDQSNYLGERLEHIGRGQESVRLYGKAISLQREMKAKVPKLPAGLSIELDRYGIDVNECRTFGPEWSSQIGHIGMIDLALKMRELGWWSGQPVFLARFQGIANKLFFQLLTSSHSVFYEEDERSREMWASLRSLQRLMAFPFSAFETGDGCIRSWNEAGALLTSAWQGASPLQLSFDKWFSRSDQLQSSASQMKADLGLDRAEWHVCLHVRDDAFHNDKSQSHRNASFEAYLNVVRLVRDRGGLVVRMGAASSPPAPDVEGLVDYAHSQWKSEEMDLYLMRTARCFVGTVSGMSNLAVSLDLPSAFVNSISHDAQMWHAKARFIPKNVHTRDGRILSQHDLSSDEWRWHLFGADTMNRAGLRSEDNSPDEIYQIVAELLDDAGAHQADAGIFNEWKSSLVIPHYYGAAKPSPYFVEKHRQTFLRERQSPAQQSFPVEGIKRRLQSMPD